MRIELPKLPYSMNALAPLISAETLEFHYGRHHRTYIEKLNRLTIGTAFAKASLEEMIQRADGDVFNNASQAWNHSFYWNCLSPPGSSEQISVAMNDQVKQDFGTMEGLKRAIKEIALSTFGSGWTWLVINETGHLQVISTSNADNPLRNGMIPILNCDVWEHAYYIDYRNERGKYLDSFLRLLNLTHASRCFDRREVRQSFGSRPLLLKISPQISYA